jgi:hypothetical protein
MANLKVSPKFNPKSKRKKRKKYAQPFTHHGCTWPPAQLWRIGWQLMHQRFQLVLRVFESHLRLGFHSRNDWGIGPANILATSFWTVKMHQNATFLQASHAKTNFPNSGLCKSTPKHFGKIEMLLIHSSIVWGCKCSLNSENPHPADKVKQ